MALAVAVVGASYVSALLALSTYAPRLTTRPQAQPVRLGFASPFLVPQPTRRPPPARRKPAPKPPMTAEPRLAVAAPRQPPPGLTAGPAAPAAPTPPGYGRWTVTPGSGPPQAVASTGLSGCTPQAPPALSGSAREACARRLSEIARNAPAFPLTADPRKAKDLQAEAAYGDAVRAWRSASAMGPHPCPPQEEKAHKLYFDKCSLVNAARHGEDLQGRKQSMGVKLEFKYRF